MRPKVDQGTKNIKTNEQINPVNNLEPRDQSERPWTEVEVIPYLQPSIPDTY